jgi:hypothetical protein
MFRRTTDLFIQARLGKRPLDVGVDRIARTAYAALRILGTLRVELGMPIPLAWAPADVSRVAAIEVYPAATLLAHRIRSIGYKKRHQIEQRGEIIEALRARLILNDSVPDLSKSRCGGLPIGRRRFPLGPRKWARNTHSPKMSGRLR